jgi:hypothetical protein
MTYGFKPKMVSAKGSFELWKYWLFEFRFRFPDRIPVVDLPTLLWPEVPANCGRTQNHGLKERCLQSSLQAER